MSQTDKPPTPTLPPVGPLINSSIAATAAVVATAESGSGSSTTSRPTDMCIDAKAIEASTVIPPTDSPAPMQITPPNNSDQLHSAYTLAFKRLAVHKPAAVKPALKQVQRLIQNLSKKPEDPANRRLRLDNPIIKKFVTTFDGAVALLEEVGFKKTEIMTVGKAVQYLAIEESAVQVELLDRAVELIQKHIDESEAVEKAPAAVPSGPKKVCVGDGGKCPFFGETAQDGLCSVCYKKKHAPAGKPEEKKKDPTKCIKNCGFYGLDKFKGMCYKCYEQIKPSLVEKKALLRKRWRVANIKLRAARRFRLSIVRPVQKDPTRCWVCQRKVGLTGIDCRCGYIFCGKHRYADEHGCTYDHKSAQRKKLAKENREVRGEKFDKIG